MPQKPAIAFENARFEPQVGTPYARADLLPAESQSPVILSAGELVYESGIFQVTLHFPEGEGTKKALVMAEAVREHFPKGLRLQSEGLTVIVKKRASVAGGFNENGWYVVPISVPYFSQVSK